MSYHVSILMKEEETNPETGESEPLVFEFPEADEHNYVGNWVVIVQGARTIALPSDGILSVSTRPYEEPEATLTSVTFETVEGGYGRAPEWGDYA
jgi:hypothetical protein